MTAWRAFPVGAHWALAVPLVAAGAAVTWGLRGRERTTGGELAAGVALQKSGVIEAKVDVKATTDTRDTDTACATTSRCTAR